MRLRFVTAAPLLALLFVCGATRVSAQQSSMAEGLAHFEAGEFEEAREAFDRALWQTRLSTADFQQLLVHRATLAIAEGDQASADEDLLRLASLDPEHSFGRDAPPQVRESFERAATRVERRLSFRTGHEESEGQTIITSRVVSDITGLVTDVRVFARAGDGEYETGSGTVELEARDGDIISYYTEALGPGESIVAQEGTRGAPLSLRIGGPEEARGNDVDEGGSNTGLWVTLVIIGALAIAGGIVAAVLLTQESETSVQPMIRF